MIEHYARSGSFRQTADSFGVGYRSLHRHIDLCVTSILAEQEEKEYQKAFRENAEWLRSYFTAIMRKPRPTSIIKKEIEWTWSRRSWQKKAKKG
jgi:hypothetical protein